MSGVLLNMSGETELFVPEDLLFICYATTINIDCLQDKLSAPKINR